jgi:hypothetical protein
MARCSSPRRSTLNIRKRASTRHDEREHAIAAAQPRLNGGNRGSPLPGTGTAGSTSGLGNGPGSHPDTVAQADSPAWHAMARRRASGQCDPGARPLVGWAALRGVPARHDITPHSSSGPLTLSRGVVGVEKRRLA